MRKIVGLLVCLSLLFCCSLGFAYTVEVREHLPGRYLLIAVYGMDPNKPVDEEYIKEVADAVKFFTVEQLKIAIYDKGATFGDGMRAVFEGGSRGSEDGWLFEREREKPLDEESELYYSEMLRFVYDDLIDNTALTNDLYKNSSVRLYMYILHVGTDEHGVPYVTGEDYSWLDDLDSFAKVYLSKDDPFLSQLKVGACIGVQGRVIRFSKDAIILKGKIRSETRVSADGAIDMDIIP